MTHCACDMTHSTSDMTHFFVWRAHHRTQSGLPVPWLIHMCDMTHSMCDMTHSFVWRWYAHDRTQSGLPVPWLVTNPQLWLVTQYTVTTATHVYITQGAREVFGEHIRIPLRVVEVQNRENSQNRTKYVGIPERTDILFASRGFF